MTEFQTPGNGPDRADTVMRESANGSLPDPFIPGASGAAGHMTFARKRHSPIASGIHPRKGERAKTCLRGSAENQLPAHSCAGEANATLRETAEGCLPPGASLAVEGAEPRSRGSAEKSLPFDGDTLRDLVHTRRQWQQSRNRLYLQALSICRSACEGDKAAAVNLYKATAAGGDRRLATLINPMIEEVGRWDDRIEPLEKSIVPIIKDSPVGPYIASTKGIGALSVGTLIGMTGPLSNFATVAKLWRFCGLSVSDGKRAPLVDPGRADLRPIRAVAYVISAGVIKAGNPELRAVYDREKAKALGKEWPKARAHNHAMRYVAKSIIRRMWKDWRAAA